MIVVEDKRAQIMSGGQPLQVGDVPGDGGKVCQAEQVLLRQRSSGLLQRLADGGVQAWIGNRNFLREG